MSPAERRCTQELAADAYVVNDVIANMTYKVDSLVQRTGRLSHCVQEQAQQRPYQMAVRSGGRRQGRVSQDRSNVAEEGNGWSSGGW